MTKRASTKHSTPSESTRQRSTPPPPQPLPGAKQTTSFSNWAGYQVDLAMPTRAHATWVVPNASWPGRDGYSNVWVGLGGGTKAQGQLIQAGTEQDVVCTAVQRGGCTAWSTQTYAWIETYPQRNQERITNLDIVPGDSVDVAVRWSAPQRTAFFTLCNDRTSECVETSRVTSAPKNVAEFIVERPSMADGTVRALANVGTVAFTALDVQGAKAAAPVAALPGRRIHMETTQRLATTSLLDPKSGGFSVTFAKPS